MIKNPLCFSLFKSVWILFEIGRAPILNESFALLILFAQFLFVSNVEDPFFRSVFQIWLLADLSTEKVVIVPTNFGFPKSCQKIENQSFRKPGLSLSFNFIEFTIRLKCFKRLNPIFFTLDKNEIFVSINIEGTSNICDF